MNHTNHAFFKELVRSNGSLSGFVLKLKIKVLLQKRQYPKTPANPVSVMVTTRRREANETLDVCLCQNCIKKRNISTTPCRTPGRAQAWCPSPHPPTPGGWTALVRPGDCRVPVSEGTLPSSRGCRAGASVQEPGVPPCQTVWSWSLYTVVPEMLGCPNADPPWCVALCFNGFHSLEQR